MRLKIHFSVNRRQWAENLIKITLLLSLFGTSCSLLRRAKTSGKERKIASVSRHLRSQRSKAEDPIDMLKNGTAVISKAVYFKDGNPVCFININQKKLIPDFATPASSDFSSHVSFKTNFPSCGVKEKNRTAHLARGFVIGGTQMAGLPFLLLGMAITTIGTCSIAVWERVTENPMSTPKYTHESMTTGGAIGASAGVIAGDMESKKYTNDIKKLKNVTKMTARGALALGGGAIGAGGGAVLAGLGYLICGETVRYIIEENRQPW